MDDYEEFNAFYELVVFGELEERVERHLDEMRQRDPVKWMLMHERLARLLESPVIGTVGQQMRVVQSKAEYLMHQAKPGFGALIGRLLAKANRHYGDHRPQLMDLITKHSLRGTNSDEIVEDFLKSFNIKTPPQGAD